jgi:hypothetical protein
MMAKQDSKEVGSNGEEKIGEDLIARDGKKSRPYGDGTQVLVMGVHGSISAPFWMINVRKEISGALRGPPSSMTNHNTGFSWQDNSQLSNLYPNRTEAAERLANKVVNDVYSYDRSKPTVINLVGHNHGGNVCLQAAGLIAEKLSDRGFNNVAIHVTTLSTPAYDYDKYDFNSQENPRNVASTVRQHGSSFQHTNFYVKPLEGQSDIVVDAATGGRGPAYNNEVTKNYYVPQTPGTSVMNIHTQLINDPKSIRDVAYTMRERFKGFAPTGTKISDTGIADEYVTSAGNSDDKSKDKKNLEISLNASDFHSNAMVKQAYAALVAADKTGRDNEKLTPCLVAGLVQSAHETDLKGIAKVVFSKDASTIFIMEEDRKINPSANIAKVDLKLAEEPFDKIWGQTKLALQTTQAATWLPMMLLVLTPNNGINLSVENLNLAMRILYAQS